MSKNKEKKIKLAIKVIGIDISNLNPRQRRQKLDGQKIASALIVQVIKVYLNTDIVPTRIKLLSTKINYFNHYLIKRILNGCRIAN